MRLLEILIICEALLQEKEMMMKMRVRSDEDGACCTAGLIAGDLTGGIKISVISFQLGGELKSTIWCNCLHAWSGSSAITVSLSLHQILVFLIFFWGGMERASLLPPLPPSSEHVMLMCIIMPGSGKTLPYVARTCFPFKICEWMSCSRSQVRAGSCLEFYRGIFSAFMLFVDFF